MTRTAVALVAALVAALATGSTASAGPCPVAESSPTSCTTVTVPLDRSGQVAGSVHLFVEVRAARQHSQGALLVVTGGPGQAASPLIDQLQTALAPALSTRDLVVMDLRGTGRSDPLSCPQLDAALTQSAADRATTACALSLGAARGFYTSRDDADDIDAVRQALGYERISLYGVSYGTYIAMTYARRHPDHVAELALDSVVDPDGRDPLDRQTYAAIPHVLRDTCAAGCGRITRDPVALLARLAHRLERRPLATAVFLPNGRRVIGTVGAADLFRVLVGGDLDPLARAETPAAMRAALSDDGAPLARLLIREHATTGDSARAAQPAPSSGNAVFLATSCEEEAEPWSRTAPLSARPAQAAATIARVPASAFAPFTRALELAVGTSRPCLAWPDASPISPAVSGPLPDVRALILGGVDDTRTPLPDAAAAAALLPHGQLVAVPHTGHSTLGTDLGTCAQDAVASFFSGQPIGACSGGPVFVPAPVPPRSLGAVPPLRRSHGRRGKTAAAAIATVDDSLEEALSYVLLGMQIRAGGLRGGHISGSFNGHLLTLRLTRVVYVPGVVVSGSVRDDLASSAPPTAVLRVGGRAAAHGSLLLSGGTVVGHLSRVVVSAAAARRALPPLAALLRARALARLRSS